uniref:Uncharacterized protein n=1 Tax=Sinocyclocheilus grahami TaxID=75366 RepID=A0A672LKI9_SINGR
MLTLVFVLSYLAEMMETSRTILCISHCRIIRERLLEAGVPQIRRVEGRNTAPLRAALQEEWNAMPQQTITVIDAQGHMTILYAFI